MLCAWVMWVTLCMSNPSVAGIWTWSRCVLAQSSVLTELHARECSWLVIWLVPCSCLQLLKFKEAKFPVTWGFDDMTWVAWAQKSLGWMAIFLSKPQHLHYILPVGNRGRFHVPRKKCSASHWNSSCPCALKVDSHKGFQRFQIIVPDKEKDSTTHK